ncbi:hypothetical protein H9L12_08110 [Sphingomonas rhizophila]|uniref:MarR family transcriptional regulator n=1 Tax=Sphingomonas rhizophila TaxID=2071607 RepID=A0A7G9S8Y4_9SPHN|nr:hypothetical protein [Sphingomonas rhizophila]QNN64309.1 hypothetical protein H9L12_08110 [Sphingomonas rhizophila]
MTLKRAGGACSHANLIERLRASEHVVGRALESLTAAGLVSNDLDTAVYMPSSRAVGASVDRAEELYQRKPNAVRRAIIGAHSNSLAAFADAFKLRKADDD